MDDDNQIHVPESFVALYTAARGGRLTQPASHVRERYEFCEDLAQMLTEQASARQFESGASEQEVLRRMRDGLAGDRSAVTPAEAGWVVLRLAELLGWPSA